MNGKPVIHNPYNGSMDMTNGVEMLILGRNLNEQIIINVGGEEVILTVIEIQRGRIRLGFEAPRTIKIFRRELLQTPEQQFTDGILNRHGE